MLLPAVFVIPHATGISNSPQWGVYPTPDIPPPRTGLVGNTGKSFAAEEREAARGTKDGLGTAGSRDDKQRDERHKGQRNEWKCFHGGENGPQSQPPPWGVTLVPGKSGGGRIPSAEGAVICRGAGGVSPWSAARCFR